MVEHGAGKQTPGSTAPAVIPKTTFQTEKTAAKETAENRKISGGDASSTAADFLDNFVQGGFDRFMSGAYGLAAMADEAVTNPLNKGLYKITGNEKYGQEYVSPLRWNSNVYAEDAENILQKTSKGRSDLGKKVMSTGQAAGNLVFGGLVTGAASPAIKTAQAAVGIQQAAGLGASSTAQAATTIRNSAATLANRLLQSPTNTLVSLGSTGSAYVDAATRGAPREKAIQNAVLAGVAEFESNRLFGGTPLEDASKKGYVTKLGEHIAEKVGKSSVLNDFMRTGAGKAVGWSTEKAGEGIEEVVTGFLAPVFERITWSPKADLATVDELWNQFEDGVALSLLMSGGDAVINKTAHGPKQQLMSAYETTSINTDPAIHTPEQQMAIRSYQKSTNPIIKQFYENSQQNGRSYVLLAPVSDRAATDIEMIIGKDVKFFSTRLDERQAYHIFVDHGPNGKADRSMADSNDVARIQYVLDNYDTIEDGGRTDAYWEPKANGGNRQARTIVFSKKVNGTYYVVEAAPITKAKSLYVVSAYMLADGKKNGVGKETTTEPLQPPDATAPWFTAETDSAKGSVIRKNISYSLSAVNPISGTPHDYAALLAELARERGGAKTLTPEQRRELEAWNSAFPELRMSEEEFLGR